MSADQTYEQWSARRATSKGITADQLREDDLTAVARADLSAWSWLTEQQVLEAHDRVGPLDKAKTKEDMGPNWPPRWDTVAPGPDGLFSPSRDGDPTGGGS